MKIPSIPCAGARRTLRRFGRYTCRSSDSSGLRSASSSRYCNHANSRARNGVKKRPPATQLRVPVPGTR